MGVSVLDKVRRWIDGDNAESVLEEAARDAQVQPRSRAEEFIVKIARAVEEVMQNELVPLPQGTAIIPTEYTIFLSELDDKEWQGVKRRGLEQGLYHILAERAKEIAGKKKLETQSFAVELRVDGTLEKGDVRVQHGWEDDNSNKTSILARPKTMPSPQPTMPPQYQQPQPKMPDAVLQSPNFVQNQAVAAGDLPQTIRQIEMPRLPNFQNEEKEEITEVQKRKIELYRLEIWQNGVRQNVIPVYKDEISIGRGSKSKSVDIVLAGDPEISRRHLSLYHSDGNFWVTNEGRNSAVVNNYELPMGQRISVSSGTTITVCSYLLRIQPTS
ncbi:MAG: FhaA domain-containing protein [Pyrinomonadaceae bacterium]